MNKLINLKTIIGCGLVLFGLVLGLSQIKPKVIDDEVVTILNIDKPSDSVIQLVSPISALVTDPTDRAKLAIFNQEFANRIKSYETDNQKTNDVYVLAAQYFFLDSLKDKYPNFDTKIVGLLESCIGSDNHVLTTEEKALLSERFLGLAWSLIQKR